MEKAKKNPASKSEAAPVEQPKAPNHTETIKAQVLAKIGTPPRLDRVEVSPARHPDRAIIRYRFLNQGKAKARFPAGNRA